MQKRDNQLLFSPSDLVTFVKSPFASWMNRKHLEDPGFAVPDEDDPMLQVLSKRGDEHERRCLQEMQAQGLDVIEITEDGEQGFEMTAAAIAERRGVIFQANLRSESFAGFADFLVRNDGGDGQMGYSIWDAKLSRHPKPYFIIQLCCYARMYEAMSGMAPDSMGVILGTGDKVEYRVQDFIYYFETVKTAFLQAMERWDPDKPPVPDGSADHGRWASHAEQYLKDIDHPSQVANITRGQIVKLASQGISTMADLANTGKAHIPGIAEQVFSRLRRQAQLQIKSRDLERPAFDLLPPPAENPALGLSSLPPASELDVYFDMEGYPGKDDWLEYLFGAVYLENGATQFRDWWAHDEIQEKKAFESFLDWIHQRWTDDPSMHVYHYAPYETTAIKRLMGKYGTREDKVDDLLRAGVFVDLYAVVRHSVQVGEPAYSLKNLEHLYMARRGGDVTTAASSVVYYDAWSESGESEEWQASPTLKAIRDYNEEDCVSTKLLADWLRARQRESGLTWAHAPEETAPENEPRPLKPQVLERLELADKLLASLPEARSSDDATAEDERITELLAWLLDFHRRCDKPMWWRKFERQEMSAQELWYDMDCIGDLKRKGPGRQVTRQSYAFDYEFDPDQDTKLSEGARVWFSPDISCSAGITAFDPGGELTLQTSIKQLSDNNLKALPEITSIIPNEFVDAERIAESIFRIVKAYEETGTLRSCLDHFLRRSRPQLRSKPSGKLIQTDEDVLEASIRIAGEMEETSLCIQGPPGSGKTYTSARIIQSLLGQGRRVGVTSNSHKAVLKLMEEVCKAGYTGKAVKVGGPEDDPVLEKHKNLWYEQSTLEGAATYEDGLLGGTAWLFSREEIADKLDYLFVDEAGQVSVANLVGMSSSTRNIVLMGDQMQLGQPIQGSHPGESGQSILEYYLQGHATIPDDLGIFLGTTWRMHPDVCTFISNAVYEGRLEPEPHNINRVIEVPASDSEHLINVPAGIVFVPVEHEGNTQGSDEEVEAIVRIVDELKGRTRFDRDGNNAGPIDVSAGMIFVSPYNLQVRKLTKALPEGARIASVDKFQGQQAPIVIVSMCCSPGEYETRGLKFVLDPNRLNVAISRAQSLAIVVGDPRLVESPVSDIDDMKRLNFYCWLLQVSQVSSRITPGLPFSVAHIANGREHRGIACDLQPVE